MSGSPNGLPDVVDTDPLTAQRIVQESPVRQQRLRSGGHHRPPHWPAGDLGDEVLHCGQQGERKGAFGQRHIGVQQDGGQCGADRNGDHQIKGVQLGQRAFARHPQSRDQEDIRRGADQQHSGDVGPRIEPHDPPLSVAAERFPSVTG